MRRTVTTHPLLLAASLLVYACGGDSNPSGTEPRRDASVVDTGASEEPDAGSEADTGCVDVPEHSAILNAASASEKLDKQPVPPLLNRDGTLPPLP